MGQDLILEKHVVKSERKYWHARFKSRDMKYLKAGQLKLLILLIK